MGKVWLDTAAASFFKNVKCCLPGGSLGTGGGQASFPQLRRRGGSNAFIYKGNSTRVWAAVAEARPGLGLYACFLEGKREKCIKQMVRRSTDLESQSSIWQKKRNSF